MRAPAIAVDTIVSLLVANLDTAIAAEASESGIPLEAIADDSDGESGKAIYTEMVTRYGYPYVCIEPPEGPVEDSGRSKASEISQWVLIVFQESDETRAGRICASYLSALASAFPSDCTPSVSWKITELTSSPLFQISENVFVRVVGVRVMVKVAEA